MPSHPVSPDYLLLFVVPSCEWPQKRPPGSWDHCLFPNSLLALPGLAATANHNSQQHASGRFSEGCVAYERRSTRPLAARPFTGRYPRQDRYIDLPNQAWRAPAGTEKIFPFTASSAGDARASAAPRKIRRAPSWTKGGPYSPRVAVHVQVTGPSRRASDRIGSSPYIRCLAEVLCLPSAPAEVGECFSYLREQTHVRR